MGCQGEIYVVYGVQVPAKIVFDEGNEEDDDVIVYEINGLTVAPDEYKIEEYEGKKPLPKIDLYEEFYGPGYGKPDDMDKVKLSIIVLGDNVFGMGSRHFKEKALLGYVVGNESYCGSAVELPAISDIEAQSARLIRDIAEKVKLNVQPSDLRLHLYFSFLNGF